MQSFITKFKLIFLPFLLITICTICVYTFLDWLIFIKYQLFNIDEDIINLFGPMILVGVPILIWLRPRIKLLDLTSKKGSSPLTGYILFAWMAMIAPIIIAQAYLTSATGKLTKLVQISQIDSVPKTKYYILKHFYIDKRLVRSKSVFDVSGKYNTEFNMTIYAPCPIFDYNHITDINQSSRNNLNNNTRKAWVVLNGMHIPANYLAGLNPKQIKFVNILKGNAAISLYGDSAKYGVIQITTFYPVDTSKINIKPDGNKLLKPLAWLAIKYQKTISNKLSKEDKKERYKEFAKESQSAFNSKTFDSIIYFDKINTSKDLKNYTEAVNTKPDNAIPTPVIVFRPVYEPFEKRNGNKFAWIFGSLGIGAIIFLITLLFKPLKGNATNDMEEKTSALSGWEEVKLYFLPRDGFYSTPIIIDINLIVFISMALAGFGFISFNTADLLKYGANYRPLFQQGQYWRLVTNIFIHGGIMHLLFNMYGLLFVGIFLEPLLGCVKFIVVYLATGIVASITSVCWHIVISVGASGAIFGLYGVFLALLTTNLFPKDFKKSFLLSTSVFIIYNLLVGLTGGIDNAAHIGGLLSGLIIGYALYPTLKDQSRLKEAEAESQKMLEEFK